jgi:predicted DNA-binding protein
MSEPDKKLERLNVQLDAATRSRLNNLASATGWSVAEIIRLCIKNGLDITTRDAFADQKVQAHIEEQRRKLQAIDMLRLEQNAVPPAEDKVEAKLRELRQREKPE